MFSVLLLKGGGSARDGIERHGREKVALLHSGLALRPHAAEGCLFPAGPAAGGPRLAAMDRLRRQISSKEVKEAKEAKEPKEVKEANEPKESKEMKEAKEPKEAKETKDEVREDASTFR